MIDTFTSCSGYEFYVTSVAAEQQMRRAFDDNLRIQHQMAAQHDHKIAQIQENAKACLINFFKPNNPSSTNINGHKKNNRSPVVRVKEARNAINPKTMVVL